LSGFSQNRMPRGPTLVNPTTDWRIIMQQRATNLCYVMLYNDINYNDVMCTSRSHKYARKVYFTDVQTIKNFLV